jgi:mono/diheme cytochrome c family protein/glucose/arabinose dehydrogenase
MSIATRGRRRVITGVVCAAGLAGLGGHAQVGDRAAVDVAPPPAEWNIPASPVRTPEESIRLMELAAGFRVELVAAEPLVQDPISFAFDRRGRLWVLEWPTYNWELRPVLDLPPEPPPASRVVLLEDTTGDGRMDRRTVFAEIDWPRGIQPLDDGVLVFALPEVLFLRDTNGDGRSDSREVVVAGLPVPVNPHAAPSSPLLSMDNWIYALRVDERLRRRAGRWEREPAGQLPGQWGLSQDDHGRLFFSYNQDAVRGSLVPPAYATRNPNYAATAGIDVRVGTDNVVWPHGITPGVNRRAQLRDDGRLRVFTANAAPSVYRADHFPEEFHGNVFVVESAGRLIRRFILSEDAGIVTGRNAYDEREFLFSEDERFRPVFTAAGPDGALYVADMYRGIIEGHLFVTTFLRNQIIDRRLQQPFHGMGRIYRIVHEKRSPSVQPRIPAGDAQAWVAHLGHASGYWRDLAQQSIVASRNAAVIPAVRRVALSHADPRARLQALWTLDGLGAADEAVVRALLQDAAPSVRMAALRVGEPLLDNSALRRAAIALADDSDLAVRRQLVYSLGATRAPEALDAMLRILQRDGGEPFVAGAAVSGLAGRERAVLARIVAAPEWRDERPGSRDLIAALSTAVINEGRPDRVEALVRLVADEVAEPVWRRLAMLQGIDQARRPEQDSPPSWLSRLADVGEPAVRERALKVVARWTAGSRAAGAGIAAKPDAATAALIERGRTEYAVCAACHQPDGRGLPSMAPPLVGASTVSGRAEALIDVVLQGRDVDPAFPAMSPLTGLSDDQLAAILTYIRQAWGHTASAVSADLVRARRSLAR